MGSYYAGMMNSGYGPALRHYRTEGSKNGIRLYQYEDGSLTPLGREHYGVGEAKESTQSDAQKSIDSWKKTVNDEGTVQELEAIERKLKTGAMSEEEAMAEATTAVALDKERAEYRRKKAEKERLKKQKAAERLRKQQEAAAKRAAAAQERASQPTVIRMHVGSSGNKLSLARSGRR